jgi:hypothetical protein
MSTILFVVMFAVRWPSALSLMLYLGILELLESKITGQVAGRFIEKDVRAPRKPTIIGFLRCLGISSVNLSSNTGFIPSNKA